MAASEETSIVVDDPSDWPADFRELRMLDSLLRCSICFEYFNIAVTPTGCWHNYCSLCARKHISYNSHCPSCHVEMRQSHLKSNRVLDEIVKVFVALRPKLLSILKEYKDFKLKLKKNVLLSDEAETSSLQESRKSRKSARALRSAKPARKQKGRSSEMEDDDDSQEKKKRIGDGQSFAGSSTSSLSDFESRPAHYSKDERYLEACSDDDATQLPDSCTDLQLPKKRPQDSDDNTDFAEPEVKRRKIGDDKGRKAKGMSKEDNTVLVTEDLVLSGMEARQLSDIEDTTVIQRAASNDLLPVTESECRKKLPEFVISGFRENQLRKKLQEYGLSTKGNKKVLQNRLKSFWLLYNSQCDALNPMPVSDIIKQVESTERMQKKLDQGHILLQTHDRSKSDEEKQEFNEKYLIKHKDQFNSLIKDVYGRWNRYQKLSTTNDDTVAGTSKQSDKSATFIPDTVRNSDAALEEEEPQDAEEKGQKQIASLVRLERSSPTENRSLISEGNAQQLASTETNMHPDLEDTELSRTPQRRSCSRAKNIVSYHSREYKALELLSKVVSTALPVVEKLHATVCGTNLSLSRSSSPDKPFRKIGEVGSNTRSGADASFSKEGLRNQKASLISPKASPAATGFTNDEDQRDAFDQMKDVQRTFCEMESRDEANSPVTIIIDSDEELANENERVEGGWRHSTPFQDPVSDKPENAVPSAYIQSASSINSFKSRDSLLSTTPTSHRKSYSLRRQRRMASTPCISNEETKEDGEDSRRVRSKVKKNILTSGQKESMLKINESTSKKGNSKFKQNRCKSQRITSFFSKIDDKGKVKNEIEDSSCNSLQLFDTSSSSDSDLESSAIILEKLFSGNKSSFAGDTDVNVSCASGRSPQSRTPNTVQSTAKSKAQNAAHCTTQNISENVMQNANIHSELEEHDSDQEFLSRTRHSPKKRRAVIESSSSEEEDSDIEKYRPISHRSRKKINESDRFFTNLSILFKVNNEFF